MGLCNEHILQSEKAKLVWILKEILSIQTFNHVIYLSPRPASTESMSHVIGEMIPLPVSFLAFKISEYMQPDHLFQIKWHIHTVSVT